MDDNGLDVDLYEDDDEDDDHLMGWEQEAQAAAEVIIDQIEFDKTQGVVLVDGEEFGVDDFDAIVSQIVDAYEEQWYGNVPVDGGEPVFESDAQDYAENRLEQLGFFSFFDQAEQRKAGKLVLVIAEQRDTGILIPRDSVIQLQDLGLFTSDQIAELQTLIASSNVSEADLQHFFERFPQFLSRWNHPGVHPHVPLTNAKGKVLIPDFVLCNPKDHKAAIVDLKLPTTRLIRRQRNRDRWSGAISEARSQLLRYRDWFDESTNRQGLVERVGMEIYKPSLAVLVGHGSEFKDAFDRQLLISDMPDVEVVTYDELANWAAQRKVD